MPSTTTTSAATPIMDRLREETRADHDATEANPFSAAMVNQTLPKARYVAQLAALAVVHDALEDALAETADERVRTVWREDLRKGPLLERDLAFFADEAKGDAGARALDAANDYAAEIRRLRVAAPVALLGHLYVLEGSTLGGTILRNHIKAAYGLDRDGLAYYTPYGNAVMPHWREFKQRMNDAVTDSDSQEQVLEAARDAFRRIGAILEALSEGLSAN